MGRTAAIVPASTAHRTGPLRESLPAGRAGGRALSGSTVEARLALTEVLIGSDPGGECAERTVQWLVEYAGAQQVLCLGLDNDEKRLIPLSSFGLSPGATTHMAFEVEDRSHPVVNVLFGRRAITFDARSDSGLLSGRSFGVPLYGFDGREDVPMGVLLASPANSELIRDGRWVSDLLGHKLFRWRRLHAAVEGERKILRERMLLDAVPDPILLTDTEGRLLLANARAQTLFSASEHESEGRRRAVALNNMLFSSALVQVSVGETEGARRELLVVDPIDGSDLLFELMSTVANDSREGSVIISILRNITDLRKATEEIEENYRKLRIAEAAARAERDRLDLIIDSVADPILVTDPSGALAMMNAPAERLFVVPEGAAEEKTRRVSANDAHFSSFVSNLFFAGEAPRRQGGVGLVDPDSGANLPMEAVSGKVLSEHGEVSAVVTILHDRTEEFEKQHLYEELKKASEQLEEKVRAATAELVRQNELLERQRLEVERASAAKSQFLANMSHEFRTPLNAIMGYTSMLQQGVFGALDNEQQKNLRRVETNAQHLMAIINDILDISRIEAGRLPVHPSRFSLAELISELVAEVQPLISRVRLEVVSDLDPKLPTISSDRPKVKQILLNLLTNAIKFTPKGYVKVQARRSDRRLVVVSVIDSGIGIADKDQTRVFDDFQQADNSPAREYGGVGLGLSICQRLAVMLGAHIALRSKVGKGSTFTLTLPVRLGQRP
jgi:signal transduction histidine kinase